MQGAEVLAEFKCPDKMQKDVVLPFVCLVIVGMCCPSNWRLFVVLV